MTMLRNLTLLALATLSLLSSVAASFAQAPPPVPALPDAERRTSYAIAGTTCACAVGFQLYQDSTDVANWIKVYINGVEIPQTGNWNITSPSGSIATLPRPISDAVLTFTTARTGTVQIVGAQRPRRLSQYGENRGVAARDLNQAINGIEAQLREMWDRQFRTVQAAPGETLNLLPPLATRLSQGACFDSSGSLTTCVSVPSSTFAAGNGISFTGVGPTTIAANLAASLPLVLSGTNPLTFSCPTCGAVKTIAGNTGDFTLGPGLTNSGNNIRLASGTVVGSVIGINAANSSISAHIPADDTIPQSSEGLQIISLSYTPRSASSTIVCEFTGQVSADANDNVIGAMFNGAANAFAAMMVTVTVANTRTGMTFKGSYAPGSTSTQTITFRIGAASANAALNGVPGARILGGASAAALECREIAP